MTDKYPEQLINPKIYERVLAFGITGSGKTYQWMTIAKMLLPTGAQFYVIDTDNDINYMLETQFPMCLPRFGGNVHVYPAYTWDEYSMAITKIKNTKLKPNDWVIVDKINHAWETVQRYYIKEVFKQNMGEYFLHIRKNIEEKTAGGKKPASIIKEGLSGWMDWPVINSLYAEFIAPVVYQTHCHVYCTTDVSEISKEEKNAEVLELFGQLGVKVDGQKKLGGQFHTIFLFKSGATKWQVKTIKDRSGRAYFDNVDLSTLYMQYFVLKAGWPIVD